MSATALLAELKNQGIGITLDGDKLRLSAKIEPPSNLVNRIQANKPAIIDELKTQTLRAALTRLELGETPAIRIQVSDHKQVLILRDENIPESITVNCPTFTIGELKKLTGAQPREIARLYELKIGDPKMRLIARGAENG